MVFNEPVSITDGTEAGPVDCETGNQNVSGVFPLGVTVALYDWGPRAATPQAITANATRNTPDPTPPCQLTQSSGGSFTVNLNTSAPCPTLDPN
jgi:hypothetical protein